MPRTTNQKQQAPLRFPNPMSAVTPITAKTNATTPLPPSVSSPSMGTLVKEGFAFGIGNAAAHRVVSSFFGPYQPVVPSQPAVPQPCEKELATFDACMKSRTIDEHCHEQQLSYTQCLRLSRGDSRTTPLH